MNSISYLQHNVCHYNELESSYRTSCVCEALHCSRERASLQHWEYLYCLTPLALAPRTPKPIGCKEKEKNRRATMRTGETETHWKVNKGQWATLCVYVCELESLPAERGGYKYNAGQGRAYCDYRGNLEKTLFTIITSNSHHWNSLWFYSS